MPACWRGADRMLNSCLKYESNGSDKFGISIIWEITHVTCQMLKFKDLFH